MEVPEPQNEMGQGLQPAAATGQNQKENEKVHFQIDCKLETSVASVIFEIGKHKRADFRI